MAYLNGPPGLPGCVHFGDSNRNLPVRASPVTSSCTAGLRPSTRPATMYHNSDITMPFNVLCDGSQMYLQLQHALSGLPRHRNIALVDVTCNSSMGGSFLYAQFNFVPVSVSFGSGAPTLHTVLQSPVLYTSLVVRRAITYTSGGLPPLVVHSATQDAYGRTNYTTTPVLPLTFEYTACLQPQCKPRLD